MSEAYRKPVDNPGYYYSPELAQIVEVQTVEKLPDSPHWEFIGGCDMTPADAVSALQERYPDVSVELTFKRV
ncbi:MAG: hypothetical protein ACYC27_01540 [Armatimonadota bacterium]